MVQVGLGLAVLGLLAITYFTLFPFDLVAGGESISDALGRFRPDTGPLWEPRAVPANIVLFVPFGMGLAGVVRSRLRRAGATIAAVAVVGGVLSLALEVTQARWLLREPSLDDIVANTLGAGLGAAVWILAEPRLGARVGQGLVPRTRRARVLLGIVALVPTAVILLVTIATAGSTGDLAWQTGQPAALGNEITGDRPWEGSLDEVAMADRRLTATETARWLSGTPMQDLAGDRTLLEADFEGPDPLPDGWTVRGPAGSEAALPASGGVLTVGASRWLQTDAPADEVVRRVNRSGAFTVALDVTSASPDQWGPGRILTISLDTYTGDVMVGQDGADLVVRVRSAFTGSNGTAPEFAARDVLGDGRPHRVVVAYDEASISVTIDDPGDTTTIELLPATVAMVETFPDQIDRIQFSSIGDVLRVAFLSVALFGPWCVAVGVSVGRRRLDLVAALVVLAPIAATELVLWALVPPHQLRFVTLAVVGMAALVLTAGVAAAVHPQRRAPSGPDPARVGADRSGPR